ncbi:fibronectin type III domain-containing protein [Glaciecola sp. XM2]|uniref:fibronectin type III domain-containing protein n=1 Tax=Glaciecola sp. XM2 TaxID=1914931 RepID=UPI001BDF3D74|nr:fibronectin type III domain-containing protein [Glaciecola sp. XM2]MBT1450641.1 fibronectin type III domain-containing protein [Glaciecola sp. XM2]
MNKFLTFVVLLILAGCGGSEDFDEPVSAPTLPLKYSVKLEWTKPQFRLDGAPITPNDIAQYNIYMGQSENDMSLLKSIDEASTTSTVIPDLLSGVYYISISTVDINELESPQSDPTRIQL